MRPAVVFVWNAEYEAIDSAVNTLLSSWILTCMDDFSFTAAPVPRSDFEQSVLIQCASLLLATFHHIKYFLQTIF